MLRVVVCVSGGGTNLQAMIDGIKEGRINNAGIVRVISNNRDAYALKRAEENHIPGVCISPKDYADREAFHKALLEAVREAEPDLIVLAGFLVVIPKEMIAECARRHGFGNIRFADTFQECLELCTQLAESGDAVLLSPACASWGMFPNYEERGRLFKEYVNRL